MTYTLRLTTVLTLVLLAGCGGKKSGGKTPDGGMDAKMMGGTGGSGGSGGSGGGGTGGGNPDGGPAGDGGGATTGNDGALDQAPGDAPKKDGATDAVPDMAIDVMAPPYCMDGATRCNPVTRSVEMCNAAAGAWMSKQMCSSVCAQGACTGDCVPGAKQCSNLIPQACNTAGHWESGTACPGTCTDGVCMGTCTTGSKQCGPDQTPQTCPAGTWVPGSRCPFVCSGGDCAGECTPGATRCSGTTAQFCDSTGHWGDSQGDCTAPTVLATSPATGAVAVRSDAKIVITFSEPMDAATVEMAFTSTDIPTRTFAWDAAGTVLTVTPTGGLTYATGGAAAKRYSFSLAATAADRSGNKLAQPLAISFTTARKVDVNLLGTPEMSASVAADGGVDKAAGFLELNCFSPTNGPEIVDFITFDLSSLPDGVTDLQSASVKLTEFPLDPGQTFPIPAISVGRVHFESLTADTFETAATPVGTLTKGSGAVWTIDSAGLRTGVLADYADRASNGNVTQLRLRVDADTCEGKASFDFRTMEKPDSAPTLSLSYLVP